MSWEISGIVAGLKCFCLFLLDLLTEIRLLEPVVQISPGPVCGPFFMGERAGMRIRLSSAKRQQGERLRFAGIVVLWLFAATASFFPGEPVLFGAVPGEEQPRQHLLERGEYVAVPVESRESSRRFEPSVSFRACPGAVVSWSADERVEYIAPEYAVFISFHFIERHHPSRAPPQSL